MRVLVVGGSGYVGRELVAQARAARHEVEATRLSAVAGDSAATWHSLDLRDRAATAEVVAAARPEVVVNAAYRQDDWATTADGAAHVALAARAVGARLVHVSSDVVFAGRAWPYVETDRPSPITAYGGAKAAAETAVLALDPAAVVARTSLVLGPGSPQEVRVHDLVDGRVGGVLFTDDVRCPVHVADLAAALLELAGSEVCGVVHLAGPDAVSRYELGLLVAARDGLDETRLSAGLRAELGPPAPLDVRLDSAATQARLRTRLRGVREVMGRQ